MEAEKITIGGRRRRTRKQHRTRRVNTWAKAAGEYYRSHKNDPDIEEFSDVLKSPKFKEYYNSKYGKNVSSKSRGRFGKTRRFKHEDEDMEEDEPMTKAPKGRKGKAKGKKAADDWGWGWESDKKGFKEEEQQGKERFQKNELFNGGKKEKKGGKNQQQEEGKQQQQEGKQQQQEE